MATPIILPKSSQAVRASITTSGRLGNPELHVAVSDQKIRDLKLPHDGYEKVSLVVRNTAGEKITVPIANTPPSSRGIDIYDMSLLEMVNRGEVSREALEYADVMVEISGPNGESPNTLMVPVGKDPIIIDGPPELT
jgi:hypothetical protein